MGFLTNTCTYAIRAALHVAAANPAPGVFVSTRRIADELDVPFAFLTKVLQGLTQAGILLSQRGASGGVALARPADTITLIEIVTGVGSDGVFHECVLGLPSCSDATPCALHGAWGTERNRLETLFTRTTLGDLVSGRGPTVLPDSPAAAATASSRDATQRRSR